MCLTPSPSFAASREKASHGERAESRGDQETLPGVHLESRREPGAPEQRPDRGTRDVRHARAEPFSAIPTKRRLTQSWLFSREKSRFSRVFRSFERDERAGEPPRSVDPRGRFQFFLSRLARPRFRRLTQDVLPPPPLSRSQLYWPDDGMWYKAEVVSLNQRARTAKVLYATGDVETLSVDEIAAEGHLNVCA